VNCAITGISQAIGIIDMHGNSKNDGDYQALRASINTLYPLDEDLVRELYLLCCVRKFKKGEYFVMAGEIPAKMGFNLDGVFRLFYVDSDANDFTKGFSIPGRFIVSYSSMAQNRPSYFSIEAMNECRILEFQFERWMEMAGHDIRWYPFLFKLMESVYFMKEAREMSFLTEDALTRYRRFKREYPGLEERIPQYIIASFIGISPEALSRIKKRDY